MKFSILGLLVKIILYLYFINRSSSTASDKYKDGKSLEVQTKLFKTLRTLYKNLEIWWKCWKLQLSPKLFFADCILFFTHSWHLSLEKLIQLFSTFFAEKVSKCFASCHRNFNNSLNILFLLFFCQKRRKKITFLVSVLNSNC